MIVFFHGFASAGKGFKSDALKKAFGDDNVIAPDLPPDPLKVYELVREIAGKVPKTEKLIFVGTSLGGFYAHLFGQMMDCPCVIVNPSTRPSMTMAARLGSNTNLATGEQFDVTEDHLATFGQMEEYIESSSNGALVSLFLAADDAVLDHKLALEDVPYHKTIVITPDGGHRYEAHWDKVIDEVRSII
jgi:uncharacterized protein